LNRPFFIRLRIRPRACPWMNVQTIVVLRRDVAQSLRWITTGLLVGLHVPFLNLPAHRLEMVSIQGGVE